MKKVLGYLLLAAATGIVGSNIVRAADTGRLTCDTRVLAPGESTNCTVYVTSEQTSITEAAISLSTSQYISVSSMAGAEGFTLKPSLDTNIEKMVYDFNKSDVTPVTAGKEFKLATFTITVSEEAKNLTTPSCGALCLTGLVFNSPTPVDLPDEVCFSPTIGEGETTPGNPETGSFANYLAIVGCAGVAVLTVAVVGKKNKFYRV